MAQLVGSSPRPRGWSRIRPAHVQRRRVVPAPAGVVPAARPRAASPARRPRARGGGPLLGLDHGPAQASSPRPRGWSLQVRAHAAADVVVPAPAGVVPASGRRRRSATGRPRARGGGPPSPRGGGRERLSSPRPRGWSPPLQAGAESQRVVPAPAGVVPRTARASPARSGRPRARGGGPGEAVIVYPEDVSSPRPRGWSLPDRWPPRSGQVVPAPAGVVPSRSTGACAWRSVVPAPAGVVPGRPRRAARRGCRPRARGGGPGPPTVATPTVGSSPRPRGWSRTAPPTAAR